MKKLNNILTYLNKIFREETNKILLGRWSVSYCPNSIKKKVYSGNTDHCGSVKCFKALGTSVLVQNGTCSFEKLQKKYDNEDDDNDKGFTNNQKGFTNNQKGFTNNQKVFTNNQKDLK
jgi:hypothetical protein